MTTATADGSGFVHLHNHTEHSALDGLQRIGSMVRTMAALGQKAGAITDHDSLAAAWKFQKAALAAGIKPIIGCEFYLAIGSRFEQNYEVVPNDDDNATDADEGKEKVKRYMHLTVLARNETGWKNLVSLHNKAQDSYWYKPRIDLDLLEEHGEGLIILTGCLGGPVAGPLARAGKIDMDFQTAMRKLREQLGDNAPADLETVLADETAGYLHLKSLAAAADQETKAAMQAELRAFAPKNDGEPGWETGMIRAFATGLHGTPHDAADLRATARGNLDRLIKAVGRKHVFIEVMYHGIGAEAHAFRELRTLSAETGIPLVATNDCHYEKAGDSHAHDGFLAVGVKKSLDDPNRFRFNGTPDYYLKSEAEMLDVLGNIKNEEAANAWREAVANSVKVADLCADKVIPSPGMLLPKFPIPDGYENASAYLTELVREGAIRRYGYDEDGNRRPLPDEVKERLRTELDIINDMGFPDYFLIVWDVINWARSDKPIQYDRDDLPRKRPIFVGPGRGSAAGSAVSYTLGIVDVCPLENNLLFERFLEPGRAGMPDIDTDFEYLRRSEVFAYLAYRWGIRNVAHIGTFGVAGAKAALKDAARILKPSGPTPEQLAAAEAAFAAGDRVRGATIMKEGHVEAARRGNQLLSLGNKLSALVPGGASPYSFEKLLDATDPASEAFRLLLEESGADGQAIMELAQGFEGIVKNVSIHACGFVVSPVPLDDLVPLRRASHSKDADPNAPRVICWDGGDVEEYGFLKMDILGLMNLDIAHRALDYILDTTGEVITMDSIPHPSRMDDPKVAAAFELVSSGRTAGIFQMESPGMIKVAQDVRPSTLTDLSAVVALFRPGPLAAKVPDAYARRKHGLEPVDYDQFTSDPVEQEWIAKVLGETNGLFVFQESLMRLGTVIAGFDAGQRSVLRKAVGKKIKAKMDEVGVMLAEGAEQEFYDPKTNEMISPVFSKKTAAHIFSLMQGSADYLFNASHSAAYAYLAYVTAYLKANWPVEYSAAVLSVADKDEKRQTALSALRADGITVRAPDVNLSGVGTAPVDGEVFVGLSEIKGVGSPAAAIVAEREKNGPFTSLHDLMRRVIVPNPDGAPTRLSVTAIQGLIEAGALDSFGPRLGLLMIMRAAYDVDVAPVPGTWSDVENATRQRQRLGTSLGTHPLVSLKETLKAWRSPIVDSLTGESMGTKLTPLPSIPDRNGSGTITVGVISSWEEKGYSGGRRANLVLESSTDSVRAVMWDRTLSNLRRRNMVPKVGDVIAVSAKVNVRTVDVVDEELDVTTSTVTKELSINEVWPIDTGSAVDMKLPENVIDFRSAYLRARSEAVKPVAKPARAAKPAAKPAQVEAVPVRESEPAEEPAAPAPVIRLDDRRPAAGGAWAAIHVGRFIELQAPLIGGAREILKRHRLAGPPQLKNDMAQEGSVFRCIANGGEMLYAVYPDTAAGDEPQGLMDLAVQAPESAWTAIEPTHSQKGSYTWFRLDRQAAAGGGEEFAEAV